MRMILWFWLSHLWWAMILSFLLIEIASNSAKAATCNDPAYGICDQETAMPEEQKTNEPNNEKPIDAPHPSRYIPH